MQKSAPTPKHAACSTLIDSRIPRIAWKRPFSGRGNDASTGRHRGGPDHRHDGADQWLFVVGSRNEANLGGERIPRRDGTLLLIARGSPHEIRNTGDAPPRTLNFYVPPAYAAEGEELPAGKPA
ncbi:MAG: cupin domain-containing protein [Planctomycetaceae bacterium]|nr:cupin domain-containing protein [Planctomycetaceae bacterium]